MNLAVGEAGVGFADIDEPAVVAHGERVIGEEAAALAVAVFGDSDDDVERGEGALELHPKLAATAGDIGRFGRFGEQAFVASADRKEEAIFDFFDRVAEFGTGELEGGLPDRGKKALQEEAALGKRSVEQGAAVEEEQVEGDEADGNLRAGEEIDLFPAEALLEFGERDGAAVAPSDDFAVEDEIAGDVADRVEQLGEFGDAIKGAGVDFDLRVALVGLGADAIELVFDEDAVGERGDEICGSFPGGGEHDGDGTEKLERDGGEFVGHGEAEDVGDIAEEHIGALDGGERLIEGFGDGFFHEAFFQADA